MNEVSVGSAVAVGARLRILKLSAAAACVLHLRFRGRSSSIIWGVGGISHSRVKEPRSAAPPFPLAARVCGGDLSRATPVSCLVGESATWRARPGFPGHKAEVGVRWGGEETSLRLGKAAVTFCTFLASRLASGWAGHIWL